VCSQQQKEKLLEPTTRLHQSSACRKKQKNQGFGEKLKPLKSNLKFHKDKDKTEAILCLKKVQLSRTHALTKQKQQKASKGTTSLQQMSRMRQHEPTVQLFFKTTNILITPKCQSAAKI